MLCHIGDIPGTKLPIYRPTVTESTQCQNSQAVGEQNGTPIHLYICINTSLPPSFQISTDPPALSLHMSPFSRNQLRHGTCLCLRSLRLCLSACVASHQPSHLSTLPSRTYLPICVYVRLSRDLGDSAVSQESICCAPTTNTGPDRTGPT